MGESLFFRMGTDRRVVSSQLAGSFGGPWGTSCFLLGGGPSLGAVDCERLEQVPAARMAVNLAGTGLIRPHFWTAYDATVRFSRSTYLDGGVMKFVHRRRALDVVPETNFKVCECPNLYLFEGDRERGFADFLSPGHLGIVDWNDSLVQAIDIVYRLGFRTVYLLGCEMIVRPGRTLREYVEQRGHETSGLGLSELVRQCEQAGMTREELAEVANPELYHFEERKEFGAAVATDGHYFRVAESLRLSRTSLAEAGLRLISLTPGSRLNAYFPEMSLEDAAAEIERTCGNPAAEVTRGRYDGSQVRSIGNDQRMHDVMPIHWAKGNEPPVDEVPRDVARRRVIAGEIERLREADVVVQEIG